jgi:protein SCO1/2
MRFFISAVTTLILAGTALTHPAYAGMDKSYTRTLETYEVPDVTLMNQEGEKVELRKFLVSDGPLLVDFIFTTCTTICPVLSANFANFQNTILEESGRVRMVSISVDPEFDTPAEMKKYMKRVRAKQGWDFLTGSRKDIDRVLKAFNVYTLDKMKHPPVILIKPARDPRWVRLYGLFGTKELLVEYERARN